MSCVIQARPGAETVTVDRTALLGLSAQFGPCIAENVICRAMEDLSRQLGQIETAYLLGNAGDVARHAVAISPVALQIGLTDVSRVASDVSQCANRGDPAALAATCARLLRLGDSAFSSMLDHFGEFG